MKFIKHLTFITSLVLVLGITSGNVFAAKGVGGGGGAATTTNGNGGTNGNTGNNSNGTSGGGAAAAQSDACQGLSQLDSADSCTTGQNTTVSNISSFIVGLLAKIVGVVAVIMILVSGFKFVTAAGDSNAVSSARTTLIYAIVGLVIAVLAQFIASDVLGTAAKIQDSSTNGNTTTSQGTSN